MFLLMNETEQASLRFIIYLDEDDFRSLVDMKAVAASGQVLDAALVENTVQYAYGLSLRLVIPVVRPLSENDLLLLADAKRSVPSLSDVHVGKIMCVQTVDDGSSADDIMNQISEHVRTSFGEEDESDDDTDMCLGADEWHIVQAAPGRLSQFQEILHRFGPDRCNIVIKNHVYYLVYFFETVNELTSFEYFTSEFMLEPCFMDYEILAEHGIVIKGTDFIKLFV